MNRSKSRFSLIIPVIFISLILLLGTGIFALRAEAEGIFTDTRGHWAEEEINSMFQKAVIGGYEDGSFRPDKSVTRAEFVTMVNKAMGFKDKASIDFSDVNEDDWYRDEIARAVKAGYIKGDADGTMNPDRQISRQEAAVILFRLLDMDEEEEKRPADSFIDSEMIARWSKEEVNRVVAQGYMGGYPDQTFNPLSGTSRAETVAVLSRALGVLYNEPGSYGPSEKVETVEGNVTVTVSGVTLQNMIIKGDLFLTAGIGDGEAFIKNVTVEGRTLVAGGGAESVVFEDSTLGITIIRRDDGIVRVVFEGSTSVSDLVIKSGGIIEITTEDGEVISVEIGTGDDIELIGNYGTVTVEAEGANVNIVSGNIDRLVVGEGAAGSSINISRGASVNTLECNASVSVTGRGDIETLIVNDSGASTQQRPANLLLEEGLGVEIEGEMVYESYEEEAPQKPRRSSGSSVPTVSLTVPQTEYYYSETAIGSTDLLELTTNATEVTASSDNEDVAEAAANGTDIEVTLKGMGTAKITVTGSRSGYRDRTVTFTVTVYSPEGFAGGDGTADNPWQIATSQQLDNVRNYLGEENDDKYFILVDDIDMIDFGEGYDDGKGWEPLGIRNNPFTGNFDGDENTVSNLYINRPSGDYIGLFGCSSGVISNLDLVNVDITGYEEVGGLVGRNDEGEISIISVSGDVKGSYVIGGLAGKNYKGTITGSCAAVSVTGENDGDYAGGLTGENSGSIENCYATGIVTGNDVIGGLAGKNFDTIENCYAAGTVTGNEEVGGLVGSNSGSDALISRSYATGDVEGSDKVGGLAGWNNNEIENSYSLSDVTITGTNADGGGLVGRNMNSSYAGISNCYAAGAVDPRDGAANTGGLIGFNNLMSEENVVNSYYDSDTTGMNDDLEKGEPRTTAQMQQQNTYEDWDFDEIWGINVEENGGYPFLRWQGFEHVEQSTGFELIMTADPQAGGTASVQTGEGRYEEGATVSIKAEASPGYNFANWTAPAGTFEDEDNPETTFTMPAQAVTVTANFAADFAGGDGTEAEPYQIATADELNNVRYFPDACFILTDDIDLNIAPYNTGEGWEPIGTFTGSFDGNGNTISNLFINSNDTTIGLFGLVDSNTAVVQDLGLVGVDITDGSVVGAIAGYLNRGSIQNCYAEGTINAAAMAGLLVGRLDHGTIGTSYALGSINSDGNNIGGLVGYMHSVGGNIGNSYARVNADGNDSVGGLVGGLNDGDITNCYSTGHVTGTGDNAGGLIGSNADGSVSASYWDTQTSLQPESAGGEGKNTNEMTQEATFTGVGWDFDNIWDINAGENDGYPFLR